MGSVMSNCPTTERPIATGMEMSKEAFESTTMENNTVGSCAACGQSHTWSKKDAWVTDE